MAEGGAALVALVAYKSLLLRISGALLMSAVPSKRSGSAAGGCLSCNLATSQPRGPATVGAPSQCGGSLRGLATMGKREEGGCLADDVTGLERTEIGAVVAAVRRTEEEKFAGIETPASAPREQCPVQSISDR